MRMLVGFTPWIVFAVGTRAVDWRVGLVAGLIAQGVVFLTSHPRRVQILDGAMTAFFAVFAVIAFARPDSGLEHHLTTISMAWLAVVAAASIVVGRPFTLDFSAGDVSPEIAASDLFMRINRNITAVWAACFAGIAAAGVIFSILDRPALDTVATVALLIVAIRFTKQYPDRAVAEAVGTGHADAIPAANHA